MPSFTQYMAQYDHEHTNPWNKILHGIGILEGNKPAFFQGVVYFLVGPVWIAKEIKDALLGAGPRFAGKR